jgi:hypothetical protein
MSLSVLNEHMPTLLPILSSADGDLPPMTSSILDSAYQFGAPYCIIRSRLFSELDDDDQMSGVPVGDGNCASPLSFPHSTCHSNGSDRGMNTSVTVSTVVSIREHWPFLTECIIKSPCTSSKPRLFEEAITVAASYHRRQS